MWGVRVVVRFLVKSNLWVDVRSWVNSNPWVVVRFLVKAIPWVFCSFFCEVESLGCSSIFGASRFPGFLFVIW